MALPADPGKVIKQLRADLNDLKGRAEKIAERNIELEERVKILTGTLAMARKGLDISEVAKEITETLEKKEEQRELDIF